MNEKSESSASLGKEQRVFLLFIGLFLAVLLFFLREGFDTQSPLDQLARRSMEPEAALSNGRPTVFEFYADWCEACKEMAPSMLSLEKKSINKVDIVLLIFLSTRLRSPAS